MPSESEQEEEEKEEEKEVEECIHSVRLQQTKQEERRRKGKEEEDEVPDDEKDVCSSRPDGAVIDSMKKTLYSLELTRTTHERADVEERARERAQRQYEDVIGGLTR